MFEGLLDKLVGGIKPLNKVGSGEIVKVGDKDFFGRE